jgi:hypothetical protein
MLWYDMYLIQCHRISYFLFNGLYFFVFVGDPASEVLKDGCQDLMLMCQHVRSTFEKADNDFKTSKTWDDIDI